MKVFGIDFSGAINSGKYIWIAEAELQDGCLIVESCERAADHWGSRRDKCLASIVDSVAIQRESAIGFDFPFSLPKQILEGRSWEDFVLTFGSCYPTADAFRDQCWAAAQCRELRRRTDVETKTPFCVYNLRLYRQSFYGIRDILAPIVATQTARVLPMQTPVEGKPWILEICPASLLKRDGFRLPYKGRTELHANARARLVELLERSSRIAMPEETRQRVLTDQGGDALDSILAALGTAEAIQQPALLTCEPDSDYAIEGRVLP